MRFRLLAENASDIIYRIQLLPEKKFEYVSPASTHITGYTPEEYYADPHLLLKLVHPDDRHIVSGIASGNSEFKQSRSLRWIRKDGQVIWIEQRDVYLYDEDGKLTAIQGIARDITKRKRIEEKIKYMSLHDPLTGLYNRTYFELGMRRLEEGGCVRAGIIVCDVDGLKLVNDTLGHDTGDKLPVTNVAGGDFLGKQGILFSLSNKTKNISSL